MFGFLKKLAQDTAPRQDTTHFKTFVAEPFIRTIYIKIHDYEKLSYVDRGVVLKAYVTLNNIHGKPDWNNSKDGVYAFDVMKTPEEIEKERVAYNRIEFKRVLGTVRVEIVQPPSEPVLQAGPGSAYQA